MLWSCESFYCVKGRYSLQIQFVCVTRIFRSVFFFCFIHAVGIVYYIPGMRIFT